MHKRILGGKRSRMYGDIAPQNSTGELCKYEYFFSVRPEIKQGVPTSASIFQSPEFRQSKISKESSHFRYPNNPPFRFSLCWFADMFIRSIRTWGFEMENYKSGSKANCLQFIFPDIKTLDEHYSWLCGVCGFLIYVNMKQFQFAKMFAFFRLWKHGATWLFLFFFNVLVTTCVIISSYKNIK